jgi:outer membrane protein
MLALPVSAAELKVGFVNVVKIMDSAPQVEAANKRLEKEFAPKEKDILKKQQSVERLEARINKDSSVISDSELKKINP